MSLIGEELDISQYLTVLEKRLSELRYRSNVTKLYFYNFLMGFYLLAGVIIPYYLIWGKLTFLQFMFLQSYYALVIMVFEIPFGALSDRLSKKYALFLSGLFSAVATLIYGTQPNLTLFIIGDTMFALSEALVSGSNESLLYDSLKSVGKEKHLSKTIAKCNAIFLISMAIAAPLGPLIAVYFSLPMVMILMFVPYIFGTLIALTLKEPRISAKDARPNFRTTLKSGFKQLKSDKVLRTMVLDMIVIEMLIMVLICSYQYYLFQLKVPLFYFGIIASAYCVIQIIFSIAVPKFESVVKNKKKYLVVNTIAPGIAYMMIGIILVIPLLVFLILLVFGFGLSRYLLFFNGINERIPMENRTTVLNTISMIKLLIKAAILPIVGFLAMWNLNTVYIIIGALIIVLALTNRVKREYL